MIFLLLPLTRRESYSFFDDPDKHGKTWTDLVKWQIKSYDISGILRSPTLGYQARHGIIFSAVALTTMATHQSAQLPLAIFQDCSSAPHALKDASGRESCSSAQPSRPDASFSARLSHNTGLGWCSAFTNLR